MIKNKKVLFNIVLVSAVTGFLFTNATQTGTRYDESTMTCIGKNKDGDLIGYKEVSTVIKDCALVTGVGLKASSELKKMRGLDLINSSIDLNSPASLRFEASNVIDFNFNNTPLDGAEIKQTVFYRPIFQKNRISNSHLYGTKFLGLYEKPAESGLSSDMAQFIDSKWDRIVKRTAEDLEVANTQLERVTFAGFAWKDFRFEKVAFSGIFRDMKVDKLRAKNTDFSNLEMSNVDLRQSEFFDAKFKNVKICGFLNLGQSYWSHSDISFDFQSDAEGCVGSVKLNLARANLRYAEVKLDGIKSDSMISFAEADLRGARLKGLDVRAGRWNFRGALVDKETQLPPNFPYQKDLVFVDTQNAKLLQNKQVK